MVVMTLLAIKIERTGRKPWPWLQQYRVGSYTAKLLWKGTLKASLGRGADEPDQI